MGFVFLVHLQNADQLQRMREVYMHANNGPQVHTVETAMPYLSKLLWLSVKKNISMARTLKTQTDPPTNRSR